MNKYVGIGLAIALLVSAGAFVLRKATEKEQTQNTTVQVAAGGVAHISTAQENKEEKLGIGVYLERSTEGKGITFGVKYEF
jgi:hypothetical protein